MAIRDILLPLWNYPKPVSTVAIEALASLAQNLSHPVVVDSGNRTVRTRISALVCELEIEPGLYFEGAHIGEFLREEARKSAASASELEKAFNQIAATHSILSRCRVERRTGYLMMRLLVEESRLYNMTAFPVGKDNDGQQDIAERLIFESGRPVLIFPEHPVRRLSATFDNIAVAWDASRQATRAIADAMPFLRRAKSVRIFTATDDKPLVSAGQTRGLIAHLALHDVQAVHNEVKKTDSNTIGTFMEAYIADHETDLLVMGAYGHSRLRDFILGGATSSILANPPSWVLLSH